MRKYLFRGKRIGGGEWVQGGIAPAYHDAPEPMAQDGYSIISDARAYAVDQDSIGQYTGVNDKNGHPIFEDDLVEAVWSNGKTLRGRVCFGRHAPTATIGSNSMGWWIEWSGEEFMRRDLLFWREKITVVGPWADDPRKWDQWCEEAAANEQARQSM